MTPSDRVLWIIPAHNEACTIAGVVRSVAEVDPEGEVLVVDDASTDGTAARVPSFARVLRLPFNLGIGGAMQTGYRYAALHGHAIAAQVDGDGQHPPEEAMRLVRHLRETGADLVIGSRFLEPGRYRQTIARRVGIVCLRALIRLLIGRTITDCTSGLRVAGPRVIRAFAAWYPDDYPEPEVALLLARAGFRIEELPVHMRGRAAGRTSIPFLRGLFYVLKVGTALLLDTFRRPWPELETRPPPNG